MKKNYFLIGLFLLIFNHSYSAYYFQVSSVAPLTGGQSYLANQPSNPLGLSILVCAFGNSQPSYATTYTLTWYKNTVNSTVGGVMVSQSTLSTVNAYNVTDIKNYLPDTSEVGTFYYYAVLSNPQHTTCGFTTTLTSTVETVTVYNQATHLNFDGVNDYVALSDNVGNTLSGGTEVTIEYWFKGTNVQSAVRVQNTNNWIVAGWNLDQNPRFLVSTDGGTNGVVIGNTSEIQDNTWHHVACVWKKNEIFATYLDGVLKNSRVAANVNLPIFSANEGFLGSLLGSSEFTNGSLDDVRIWNVARTATQINTSKNCELQGTETGLLAYYKFNQGLAEGDNTANVTLTDATANTNNGTLTNFTLSGTISNWLAGSEVGIAPVVTVQPQDQTVVETDPLTFSVNATGVNAYQWEVSFDGGVTWQPIDDTYTNPDVSGSTTNTLTISGSNMIGITGYKFRAVLNGTSMCSILSNEALATVTLGVKSFGINNVKVYPNPSTGFFTIDTLEEVQFTVYDVVGKSIVTKKGLIGNTILDLTQFEKGIYLLSVVNIEGESNTYKLIKN